MSFLSDTKNFGLLAMVIAVVNVAVSVFTFTSDGDFVWNVIDGVGGILAGLVMLAAGVTIFTKRFPPFMDRLFVDGASSKFGVITGYTAAIGVSVIVGLGPTPGSIVWGVLVGILLLVLVWVITHERKDMISKILWVVLLVIYFFGIIHGVSIALYGSIYLLTGLCESLLFLLAFLYLFDMSVKDKFGL